MKKQTKRFFAAMLALLLTVSCVATDLGWNSLTVNAAEEVSLATVSESDTTAVSENETDATVSENETDTTVSENETDTTVSENETDTTVSENETDTTVSENETDTTVSENETDTTVSENETDTTVSENETDATVSGNEAEATVSGNETDTTTSGSDVVGDDATAGGTTVDGATASDAEIKTASVNLGIAYEAGKVYDMQGYEITSEADAEVAAITVGSTMTSEADKSCKATNLDGTVEKEFTGARLKGGSGAADPLNKTGRYVAITPKYNGELTIVVKVGASATKPFQVTKLVDGKEEILFTWTNTGSGSVYKFFEDIKVEAGTTYYMYTANNAGTEFYNVTFDYENVKPVQVENKTATVNLGIAYEAGKVYDMQGYEITAEADADVAAITVGSTMTSEADKSCKATNLDGTVEKEFKGARLKGGSGSADPLNKTGRYVAITPKYNGELMVVVKVGASATKPFQVTKVVDGKEEILFTWTNTGSGSVYKFFEDIKVEAGTTYYMYTANNAGTEFYNITLDYQVVTEEDDTLPEIELKPGVKAFDTAEGGGMYATGGRGGDVYVVTSLADDGKPGTLRYGINTAPEMGRIIVFNVGGTINLKETLKLKSNITLAGQTAPGEGITIAGYDTNISDTENVIIRFIHFRPGTAGLKDGGDSIDALWGRDNDTFIIDHCSFSWNTDECLSTYRGKNGTVQYCIISESLTVSGHSKGRHGYGGIFGGDNTVFQYNLIADHTSRNPRVGGGYMNADDPEHAATLQISNNVTYNYGYYACYGGGNAYTNYVNNYVKAGPGTRDSLTNKLIDYGETGDHVGGVYVDGNILEENGTVKTEGYEIVITGKANGIERAETAYEMPAFDTVNPVSAEEAYDIVLAQAGVTYPKRDAIDARVIQQVEDGTGYFINTQDDVGGYCAPEEVREEGFDTDMDGIPDAWETAHGLDPENYKDSRNLNEEGYAWVEVYFNELVAGVTAADYEAKNPEVTIDLGNNTMVDEGVGVNVKAAATATNGGSISKVVFFNGAEAVFTDTEAPFEYSYDGLADGTYDISVRAYDNEGNATQSETSKLHVNSTAGTGEEWTVTDIGTPGLKSTASYVDGVMTVKGAGKIGRSEGNSSDSKSVLNDATNDNFAYVYKEITGDGEIVAKLDSFVIVDAHTFNGLMFRESLDNDAASVGLGMSMVKIENTSTWSAFMVNRAKKDGNMSMISETIDSASGAANAGIPIVQDLNFKDPKTFEVYGTYLKLIRKGDTFTGYVSADGVSWQTVGTLEIDLPETAYVGFAVDANKVANDIENYATAKFSNIEINTAWANITYDTNNVIVDGAEVIAVGKDMVVKFSRAFSYLLPAKVEVVDTDGKIVEADYNAETGVLNLTNIQGDLIIKADGVKRIVTAVDFEEVDPGNFLTVTEKEDGTIVLEQTATTGSVAGSSTKAAVNQSFILFPETEDSQTLSMKIKITDLPKIGDGKSNGVFIGHYSAEEGNHAFTTLAMRAVGTSGLTGYWVKNSDKSGDGSSELKAKKYDVEEGMELDVTFYTNESGWFRVTFKSADGQIDDAKLFKAHENFLQPGDPVRYGIGILGATVEISDMTLIDYEGNEIYPGAGLPSEDEKKEMEDAIASGKTEAEAVVSVATKDVIAEDGTVKEEATVEEVVNAVTAITGTYKDEQLLEEDVIVEALDKLEEKMEEEINVEHKVDSSVSADLHAVEPEAKYAALNAPADSATVSLVIEKTDAENEKEVASSYTKSIQLDIKLISTDASDNETEISDLKVPVTVRIPAPKGFNWFNTRLMHYADGSDKPENVSYKVVNNNTVVFTVTHFSTFVFAQGEVPTVDTDDDDDESTVTTTYPEVTTDWNQVAADVTTKVNEAAASKKETVVDVVTGANTQLPAKTLQTLRGKNTTLAMHAGNGVAFSVTGQNITAQAANTSLNLAVRQNSTIPHSMVAQKLNGTAASKEISFVNQSDFGMVVNLHVGLGAANQGNYANLYRYNAQKNVLEYQGSFRIVANGQALFGLTKGGSYLVTVTKAKVVETVVAGDYTVVRGDTMYAIAARYGISLSKLIAANPQIADPNKIYVGQKLNIR